MKEQKTIRLQKMKITNFKGIQSLEIDFSDITNIYGANEAGKTTIFDAQWWLLYGKNSSDKKDFSVKPLDANGKTTDKMEIEVYAEYLVNGSLVIVKHIQKEEWTKKRGNEHYEFTGNSHLYYWNDVPLPLKDFSEKVNELMSESVFKMITSPLHFNSMPWQDQRAVLIDIAGDITDEDLVDKYPDIKKMIDNLDGLTIKEYKAKAADRRKKLKEELKGIPNRIDETIRQKPEMPNVDQINADIKSYEKDYSEISDTIENRIKAENEANSKIIDAERENIKQINDIKFKVDQIEQKHTNDFNRELNSTNQIVDDAHREVSNLNMSLVSLKNQIDSSTSSYNSSRSSYTEDVNSYNRKLEKLRSDFVAENASHMDDDATVCKCCDQPLPEGKRQEIIKAFQDNKVETLNSLNKQGQSIKESISVIEEKIKSMDLSFSENISDLNTELQKQESLLRDAKEKLENAKSSPKDSVKSVDDRLNGDVDYEQLLHELRVLEAKTFEKTSITDVQDLRVKKASINSEIDSLKRQLNAVDQIKKADDRIAELKSQEKEFAQQLADWEKQEYHAELYEKARSEEVESRVNSMFKYAKFTMFKNLVNGGQEPTCVATYKGVPFADINTAGKILVGVDIINTLSDYYGVTAPVFLDNRESVTEIPETKAQLINLIVSPEDRKLRIS